MVIETILICISSKNFNFGAVLSKSKPAYFKKVREFSIFLTYVFFVLAQ